MKTLFYRKQIIDNDPKGERNGTTYRITSEIRDKKFEINYSIVDEIAKAPNFLKAMEVKAKYLEAVKQRSAEIDNRVKDAINKDLEKRLEKGLPDEVAFIIGTVCGTNSDILQKYLTTKNEKLLNSLVGLCIKELKRTGKSADAFLIKNYIGNMT